MWTILLFGFVSFLVTYVLYRMGRFKVVRKTEIRIFTVLGVVLAFVDVVETWFGYEHEGNPFVIQAIELFTEGGWAIFALSHVAVSLLIILLGWKGRLKEEVVARTGLFFLVIYFVMLTVMNALFLKLYGVF